MERHFNTAGWSEIAFGKGSQQASHHSPARFGGQILGVTRMTGSQTITHAGTIFFLIEQILFVAEIIVQKLSFIYLL